MIKNINTHSYYSLLKSNLSIDKIIEVAINNNQKYVFLTDFNLYGSIEFRKKAIDKGLIPIIGLEINLNELNLLLFPKSEIGYKNIMKISSFILNEESFNINDFLLDIVVIFKSNYNNSIKVEDYYVTQDKKHKSFLKINEVNFETKDDFKIFKSLLAIDSSIQLDKINVSSFQNNYFNNINIDDSDEKNIQDFLNKVDFKYEIKKSNIINFQIPNNISSKKYLHDLCMNGLLNKFNNNIPNEYKKRLEYELEIIDNMGFNDYFLIVSDFIAEANNKKILIGPGRGSAAGSLVSYSLSITSIDPIKYNLIFERFLNPNRKSMPDIDIDIMDTKREEIIDYIFNKYGFDHVAHIITFQRIKSKMAIRDIARIMDIDLKIVNRISKLISSEFDEDLMGAVNSNKELSQYYNSYKELFDIASKIIGCPRQVGMHAAGIVISKEKWNDLVPIQLSSSNNYPITQYSMEYLEELGLLKIDLLGLSNLTIIFNVLKLIHTMKNVDVDLSDIPLNDKKVFDEISNAKTLGIFQLESPGMRQTLLKVKPKNIEDISLVSAIFRPGPQQNISSFVKRRFGQEKIEYIDERSKDILEPTNGILIYQEQVIELVKRVANFSSADADIFRKIISKKDKDELEKIKNKFLDGAISNGYSEKHSIDIFNYIEKFASYGFNHSHSISYALISYWMMWLKQHYTIQFMSILLSNSEGNFDKINSYCKECISKGIKVNQPSFFISKRNFSIYKNEVYFGFSNIKGIGTETSKKIISVRDNLDEKNTSFGQIVSSLSNNGIGESTIKLLIESGSFDFLDLTKNFMLNNLEIAINSSKNIKADGQYLFEPNWIKENLSKEELNKIELEYNLKQFDLIGFSFNENKIDNSKFKNIYNKYEIDNISSVSESKDIATCFLKVISINERMTKFNKLMAFIKVQDSTTENITCFNFDSYKDKISNNSYIVCDIKFDPKGKRVTKLHEVIKNE